MTRQSLGWLLLAALTALAGNAQVRRDKAVFIETIPWTEAEKLLNDSTVVVIPLGAQSKEHGPHLQLRNDWLIAEYLKNRVAAEQPVVIYPTINYHFYPAFLEYPGSTSVRMETAYSMIVDLCRVIAGHGPKKFYILNTGVSTLAPLKAAKDILAIQGILLTYTDILTIGGEAEKKIKQQSGGTHADEIETSMMLYIAPETVDMKKAARNIPKIDQPGPLTRDSTKTFGTYSPSGIYGDATLATKEKGKIVVEAMVTGINDEINALRNAAVPRATPFPNIFLLSGVFKLSKEEKVIISIDNNQLMFEGKGPRRIPMLRQGGTSFTLGERGRIVFFRDEAGKYSSAYLNWEGVDYLIKK